MIEDAKRPSPLPEVVGVLALTARFPPPRPGRIPVHKLAVGERDPDARLPRSRRLASYSRQFLTR